MLGLSIRPLSIAAKIRIRYLEFSRRVGARTQFHRPHLPRVGAAPRVYRTSGIDLFTQRADRRRRVARSASSGETLPGPNLILLARVVEEMAFGSIGWTGASSFDKRDNGSSPHESCSDLGFRRLPDTLKCIQHAPCDARNFEVRRSQASTAVIVSPSRRLSKRTADRRCGGHLTASFCLPDDNSTVGRSHCRRNNDSDLLDPPPLLS